MRQTDSGERLWKVEPTSVGCILTVLGRKVLHMRRLIGVVDKLLAMGERFAAQDDRKNIMWANGLDATPFCSLEGGGMIYLLGGFRSASISQIAHVDVVDAYECDTYLFNQLLFALIR